MAERDDALSRRYRALAREEPSAALDAAILAASRRAVGARPGGARRWAGPVSIAAVLMLGIGVSLRMQQESPGIETAAPTADSPVSPPVTATVKPASKPASKPAASAEAPAQAITTPAAPAKKPASPPPTEALAKRSAPRADSESRNAASMEGRAPMRDPAPEPSRREEPAEAAAAPPAPAAAAAPAMRAKSERSFGMNESRALDAVSDPRTVELERIARLRAEARHGEADKALEEFQRINRDYRIPEAMWERVRPR